MPGSSWYQPLLLPAAISRRIFAFSAGPATFSLGLAHGLRFPTHPSSGLPPGAGVGGCGTRQRMRCDPIRGINNIRLLSRGGFISFGTLAGGAERRDNAAAGPRSRRRDGRTGGLAIAAPVDRRCAGYGGTPVPCFRWTFISGAAGLHIAGVAAGFPSLPAHEILVHP